MPDFLMALFLAINVYALVVYLLVPGMKLLRGAPDADVDIDRKNGLVFLVAFCMSFLFLAWMGLQHANGGLDGYCEKILDKGCTSENDCATSTE